MEAGGLWATWTWPYPRGSIGGTLTVRPASPWLIPPARVDFCSGSFYSMSEFESGHMVGEGAEMMQALGQRGTVTSELLGWEPISKVGEEQRCARVHLLSHSRH